MPNLINMEKIDEVGIGVDYQTRSGVWRIKIDNSATFKKHQDLMNELIKRSMKHFNIEV